MFARAILLLFLAAILSAQPRPAFETATIKPVQTCTPAGGPSPPGRVELRCLTLRNLILAAYGLTGQDLAAVLEAVEGGPPWVYTDRFDISATGKGVEDVARRNLMLQPLLEERFRLKIHKEPRETPVYALIVAASGPKLKRSTPGGCVPYTLENLRPESEPQPIYCGISRNRYEASVFTVDVAGETMQHFAARIVGGLVGGRAIDKTGLAGQYDIHLRYRRDGTDREIFTALPEQLGLSLRPEKFAYEVIVVDSAQKPTGN